MAVGDILKIVVNQTIFSDSVQNVLYYEEITSPTVIPAEEDIEEAFRTNVLPDWTNAVTQDVLFTCLAVQKVFPDPERANLDFPITFVGTLSGKTLPARNCVLIRKINLDVTGVGKKGRVYVSGVQDPDVDKGRLVTVAVPRWTTLQQALLNTITGAAGGVYNTVWVTRNAAPPREITGFVDWKVAQLVSILASQKRRVTPVTGFS